MIELKFSLNGPYNFLQWNFRILHTHKRTHCLAWLAGYGLFSIPYYMGGVIHPPVDYCSLLIGGRPKWTNFY